MLSLELQNSEELELLREIIAEWIETHGPTTAPSGVMAMARELFSRLVRQVQPAIEGIVDLRVGDQVRHEHEGEFFARGYVEGAPASSASPQRSKDGKND